MGCRKKANFLGIMCLLYVKESCWSNAAPVITLNLDLERALKMPLITVGVNHKLRRFRSVSVLAFASWKKMIECLSSLISEKKANEASIVSNAVIELNVLFSPKFQYGGDVFAWLGEYHVGIALSELSNIANTQL